MRQKELKVLWATFHFPQYTGDSLYNALVDEEEEGGGGRAVRQTARRYYTLSARLRI